MRLWRFITILALATGLGIVMSQDPGYALFAYGKWTVEMPLWLSAFLVMLLIAFSLLTVQFTNTLFSGSDKLKQWWKKHNEHTARLQTYRGLLALTAGHWKKAERYLIKSAPLSDTPLINYLSAAKAAEENGSTKRRDHYLQLALDVGAGSEVAVRLTQAQLQLKHGELEQSIHNLQRLQEEAPKNPKVLRLLCTLYEAMNDWNALCKLLPTVRKTEALPKEAIARLEQKTYPTLLPIYAHQGLKALKTFWQEIPTSVQSNPVILAEYVKLLIQHSAHEEGERLLRISLKKGWNKDLIHLYGLTRGQDLKKQLLFAESFLPTYFEESWLLLTVGRLCLYNQLWGKARDYLEKSLALLPLPETYAELAQLMEQLGLSQKRDEYFKQGLLKATTVPPLSTPTTSENTDLCLSSEDRL